MNYIIIEKNEESYKNYKNFIKKFLSEENIKLIVYMNYLRRWENIEIILKTKIEQFLIIEVDSTDRLVAYKIDKNKNWINNYVSNKEKQLFVIYKRKEKLNKLCKQNK